MTDGTTHDECVPGPRLDGTAVTRAVGELTNAADSPKVDPSEPEIARSVCSLPANDSPAIPLLFPCKFPCKSAAIPLQFRSTARGIKLVNI